MTTKALTKPRAKKAPLPRVNLVVTSDIPEVAQAASVALALLTEGGAKTWAEFMNPEDDTFRTKALSKVVVTDELGELLDKFPTVLTWLTRECTPASTIVVCPECSEFSVTLGTCPSSCKVTPRCEGKPIRVVRAKKTGANKNKSTDADSHDSEIDENVHLDLKEQPDDEESF